MLKDDLKQLWRFRNPKAARRFGQQWRRWALQSRIPALRTFTRQLERHLDGILSHCRVPINSGTLEGGTNEITVLKRVAYGYRDDAYGILKIRAAFPGNPDEPNIL